MKIIWKVPVCETTAINLFNYSEKEKGEALCRRGSKPHRGEMRGKPFIHPWNER